MEKNLEFVSLVFSDKSSLPITNLILFYRLVSLTDLIDSETMHL